MLLCWFFSELGFTLAQTSWQNHTKASLPRLVVLQQIRKLPWLRQPGQIQVQHPTRHHLHVVACAHIEGIRHTKDHCLGLVWHIVQHLWVALPHDPQVYMHSLYQRGGHTQLLRPVTVEVSVAFGQQFLGSMGVTGVRHHPEAMLKQAQDHSGSNFALGRGVAGGKERNGEGFTYILSKRS